MMWMWILFIFCLNPTVILMHVKKDWSTDRCWAVGNGVWAVILWIMCLVKGAWNV